MSAVPKFAVPSATQIVPYDVSYLPQVMALAREMHAESAAHSFLLLDEDVLAEQFRLSMTVPDAHLLLAVRDGTVLGAMFGVIREPYFTRERVAYDMAWFMLRSERGSSLAVRLLREFEKWAAKRGAKAVMLGQSTGVDIERTTRLYERLGYATVGVNAVRVL